MVGQTPARTLAQTAKLLRSNVSVPVKLKLMRNGRAFEATCVRESLSTIVARHGKKLVEGLIVPIDTQRREIDRMLAFDGQRYVARVFSSHYPDSPELYYGGFEIFVLKNPSEVSIGGIENGPASRSGAHWGDTILSVNGVPVSGKNPLELQELFSSDRPIIMKLKIRREGTIKMLIFRFETAAHVLNLNGKRLVEGKIVPNWATGDDLHCFLK